MARAFAGAQVVILEAWLAGDIDGQPEQLATISLDLLVAGMAWAQGISLTELGHDSEPSPRANRARPKAKTPRSR
jgi:hypothetical protein